MKKLTIFELMTIKYRSIFIIFTLILVLDLYHIKANQIKNLLNYTEIN
jgi:hypothetical protein